DGPKFSTLALSPDGRWVAAGMMEAGDGIQIWDARSGKSERRLPGGRRFALFSPDGRWLAGGGPSDYRLWKPGSWEPGPVIPRARSEIWHGSIGFGRDGRLLAIASSLQEVRLLDGA